MVDMYRTSGSIPQIEKISVDEELPDTVVIGGGTLPKGLHLVCVPQNMGGRTYVPL